jgi:nicotinamide-nucleotide amidase
MSESLIKAAEDVGEILLHNNLMLATAESCTGGWVAQALTSVPGSSQWFERGFVTYTNVAKQEMLGVSAAALETHGAVSEQVVMEMVAGVLQNSHAEVALAISGIAGPGGATDDKPVGTVCLAWQLEGGHAVTKRVLFHGDRQQVREQAVMLALQGVIALLQ